MTKKDYELIARVFFNHKKRYGFSYDALLDELIVNLAEALKSDNTRFDTKRFIDACNGTCQECGEKATSENCGNRCKKCEEIVYSRY